MKKILIRIIKALISISKLWKNEYSFIKVKKYYIKLKKGLIYLYFITKFI